MIDAKLLDELERMLKANGEAGDVEVEGEGTMVLQYFVGQAGPFPSKTPVTIIGPEDGKKLASLLAAARDAERLRPPALRCGDRVRVDHPRFHGEADVVGIINYGDERGWLVSCRLENGYVWRYPADAVAALSRDGGA